MRIDPPDHGGRTPYIVSLDGQRSPSWYVVLCKPRQEAIAYENLLRQGFEVYLPRMLVRQRRKGGWVDAIQVLFPRYLFVRADRFRQSTASIRSTRGAVSLVRFGIEPAVVPDHVIESIMAREDAATGLHVHVLPEMHVGDKVRLLDGHFSGLEGVFERSDGVERAILLIEVLGKASRVHVSRDWIARAA